MTKKPTCTEKHSHQKGKNYIVNFLWFISFFCLEFFFFPLIYYILSFPDGGDTLILVSQIEVDECRREADLTKDVPFADQTP